MTTEPHVAPGDPRPDGIRLGIIDGWTTLSVSDGGGGWTPVELPTPEGTEHTRLGEFARAVRARGSESTLADFDAGLRVLRAVEYILGETQ